VLVLGMSALAALGRIDAALPGGAVSIGPYDLHPVTLAFAVSGSLMISKTLKIPKP
jgi:CDP-diacylglycerol---serine O-phosphatidyltransferase